MNNFCKTIFVVYFLILNFSNTVECGTLLGRANTNYTTTHNIFRSGQSAIGVVRMNNGFTVATPASGVGSTHGSIAFMDTCISVSGAIDLRETNTIFLLEDLKLDNGVTLSSGGNIYGYDRALILNGDLTIPTGKIIHTGGRLVIDGNGNKLLLDNSAQLFVDTDATLTLRNLVLQNVQNQPGHPSIQCASLGSKLCLDNVEFALSDDFYFKMGQLFIHNNAAITGTSALVLQSPRPTIIDSNSSLYFDIGTTFSIAPATFSDCPFSASPTTTTNNFIIMKDKSSTIHLNGCTLLTTLTGCRLTKGSLVFENMIRLKSYAESDVSFMQPAILIGSSPSTNTPTSVSWSPDDKFLATVEGGTATLRIFRFNGSGNPTQVGTVSTYSGASSVAWSPDGRFIAAACGTGNLLKIFKFNGAANPTEIGSTSTGARTYGVTWSPDGRFIAVINRNDYTLQIFRFKGMSNPILVGSTNIGNYLSAISWSPDGKFIAVTNSGSATLQIYKFTGAGNPTSVGSISTLSVNYSAKWSPDGRFISVVTAANRLYIFRFTESGNPILVNYTGTNSGTSNAVWSPFANFIAVVNATSNDLQIFGFDASGNLSANLRVSTDSAPQAVAWSSNGRFIAVVNSSSNTLQIFGVNYVVNTSPQAISNSIIFGNSALGPNYDLNVRVLSDANVNVDGILNYNNIS